MDMASKLFTFTFTFKYKISARVATPAAVRKDPEYAVATNERMKPRRGNPHKCTVTKILCSYLAIDTLPHVHHNCTTNVRYIRDARSPSRSLFVPINTLTSHKGR